MAYRPIEDHAVIGDLNFRPGPEAGLPLDSMSREPDMAIRLHYCVNGILEEIQQDLLESLLVSENGYLCREIDVDFCADGKLAAKQHDGLVDQFGEGKFLTIESLGAGKFQQ